MTNTYKGTPKLREPVGIEVKTSEGAQIAAPERRLLVILKTCMVVGICLLIIGHIVLSVTFINDAIDHRGYMLGAALSAVGVVLSLPTKLYLTVLLMEYENHQNNIKAQQRKAR